MFGAVQVQTGCRLNVCESRARSRAWTVRLPCFTDWCFAEGLNAPFQPTLDLSEAQVAALCKASPVWNMRDIATPLLLGIGGSDRRVQTS